MATFTQANGNYAEFRNAIIYASYEFFDRNGFIKFDSPILSGNAAEDSTELFETDYFGTPPFCK